MSVYVDAAIWPFRNMIMCHLTASSTEELLAMADRIGVARKWLQYPGTWKEHFDICKSKRALAVAYGAIELDGRQAADWIRSRREGADAHELLDFTANELGVVDWRNSSAHEFECLRLAIGRDTLIPRQRNMGEVPPRRTLLLAKAALRHGALSPDVRAQIVARALVILEQHHVGDIAVNA